MSGQEVILNAEIREVDVRGKLKELRKNGKIPAVLYGGKEKNISLAVDIKEFYQATHTEHGEHAIISLRVKAEGKKAPKNVIVKEVQHHPVRRDVLHVDFMQISLTEAIEVAVAIETVGLPVGVDLQGGVLDQVTREIMVKCLPTAIPDKLEVDVSALDIGDALKISDLKVPAKVEVLDDPEKVLVSVIPPTKIEEKPPEEEEGEVVEGEEGAAEPEVIVKGKKEEGGEEKTEPEVISKGKKEDAGDKDKPEEKK